MKPDLLDIVALTIDLPEHQIFKGELGAVVDQYSDDAYEIEFSDDDGQTLVLCVLSPGQFEVVWDASKRGWVSDIRPGTEMTEDVETSVTYASESNISVILKPADKTTYVLTDDEKLSWTSISHSSVTMLG